MTPDSPATDPPDPGLIRSLRAFARAASAAVALVGCLVLVGWLSDSAMLMSLLPGRVAMNPTTATAFVLAGLSLWLLAGPAVGGSRRIGSLCAALVALIAALKILSFFGWDLGVDQLLFRDKLDAASPPNRMAPNTTLNFLLAGLALTFLDLEVSGGRRPAQWPAVLSGLTALFAVIGYAYGVQYLYGVASYIPMALNTALAFCLLNLGILCARPDRGLMTIVTSESAGGVMVRRLLPAAIGIPALLGWLRVLGERAVLYESAFGVALLVVLDIVAFAALIWWTAGSLDRTDRERRRAEEALARLSHQLQLILNSAGDGIQGVDLQGRVTFANPAAARMLGYTVEALVGRPLHDVLHRSDTDGVAHLREACPISGACRDGHVHHGIDEAFWRKDGTSFPVEYVSAPIHERGEIIGAVVAFSDITERREVERMKDEFISLISHELRTPLTSISGYVALLLEGEAGPLAEEQHEFLTIVRKNAERLMGLVNELLDLSRLEAGKVELNRARLDLGPLIRDVASSLRLQIEAKGQRLELDLPDDLPSVWADPDRVTQILTNLVSNAHKYTPASGSIVVRTRGQDGRVRVEVRDTGIGLSPDEQAQLFTRFFRAHNRATREVGGTGLGLAITRSLIELHGGEITVTSGPGQGSTFCCTLPAVQS